MREGQMNYNEWLKSVPETITGDLLWKVAGYRFALFSADIGWHDVTRLMRDQRTVALSGQLYRALGSIGANLSEGYSRGSGKDRARFYEYALGSAREGRTWYYDGRHILRDVILDHRLNFLTQIVRLLLQMVPDQRGYLIEEESLPYVASADSTPKEFADLLNNVPLP